MTCKILPAIFDGINVKVKKLTESGETQEFTIENFNMIGTPSMSADNKGYCIFADDEVLFILSNPASSVSETIQVTQAALLQLATLLDTYNTANNTAISALNAKEGAGTYVPVPSVLATTIQPTIQAAMQTQQLTTQESVSPTPTLEIDTSNMSSTEIQTVIEEQEKIQKTYKKQYTQTIEAIKQLLSPIQQFLDILKSLQNVGLETLKAQLSNVKDLIANLKSDKIEVERQEKEQDQNENDFI